MSSIRNLTGKAHLQWPGAPEYHKGASFCYKLRADICYLISRTNSLYVLLLKLLSSLQMCAYCVERKSCHQALKQRWTMHVGHVQHLVPTSQSLKMKVQNFSLGFGVLSWISHALNPLNSLWPCHREDRSLECLKVSICPSTCIAEKILI